MIKILYKIQIQNKNKIILKLINHYVYQNNIMAIPNHTYKKD